MGFTGTPEVNSLGKHIARITGISLAAGASGVIKAAGGGGEVSLPSNHPGVSDDTIVIINRVGDPGGGTPTIQAAKSGTPTDTLTLKNDDGANTSGDLEVFVIDPHSLIS